jgi:hypothetical protein
MQIREGRPPRSGQLKWVGVELGRAARVRLTWMDYYRTTENVALTCRYFGDLSPDLLSLATAL